MSTSIQCFFQNAPDAPRPRGRILLISYHFPPGQTAGALRWQKLARYASERGFGLDVVTLDPADLGMRDDSSLDDLPEGIRVFGAPAEGALAVERLEALLARGVQRLRALAPSRRPATDGRADGPTATTETAAEKEASTKEASTKKEERTPASGRVTSMTREEVFFSLRAPRTWARSYWSWLDVTRNGRWARRAEKIARAIFEPGRHRLVVSCGPPHMAHLAATRISRSFGVPMVMDLRDPWSFSERIPEVHASPLFFRLASRYERRAVRQASLVVMNTEPARRAMQAAHPHRSADIVAVPNAYDERPVPVVERGRRFVIAYAGTIYLDRTPLTLFRAVATFVRERALRPDQIGIEFMGHIDAIDGETIEQIAEREGLAGYVATHPPGGFADAERFLAGGSLLVSLPQDSHMAIPSKIYDCMRFQARLLVFAEPESATAEYLAGSGADVVGPDDVEATLATLRDAWAQHETGRRPEPIASNPAYSRRAAAERLFGEIDRVLGEDTGGAGGAGEVGGAGRVESQASRSHA